MTKEPNWRTLAGEMSEISELAFCAGWMDGLEYRLWEIVQGGAPGSMGRLGSPTARWAAFVSLTRGFTDGSGSTMKPKSKNSSSTSVG